MAQLPPPPRTGTPAPLAATIGTLPTGTPVKIWDLPPDLDTGIRWLLEVDPDQGEADRLEHVYRHLDHPIRPHLWAAFGTPDPRADPRGYQRARWWGRTDHVDLTLILRMEAAGLVHPWAPNANMTVAL